MQETTSKEVLPTKTIREFKASLELTTMAYGTVVIAVAVARDAQVNKNLMIPCDQGQPLNNEVYDFVKDAFHVVGVSYVNLGTIPVSLTLRMKEIYGWEEDVPLPKAMINRFLSKEQKSALKDWRSDYPDTDYSILYLQMKEED